MEKTTVCCSACGIEIEDSQGEVIYMEDLPFCSWCWSNDCCRVSRDAAEEKAEKDIRE